MRAQVVIGVSTAVASSLLLALLVIICIRFRRRGSRVQGSTEKKEIVLPIRMHGIDSSTIMSDSIRGQTSPTRDTNSFLRSLNDKHYSSGIHKFSYKELQKATENFTSLIGKGSYGSVYKAVRETGPVLAVKVLGTNSSQGEKQFQNEVLLLGRLHHKNLVNLVGYCAEKGQRMLVYEYMSQGSLSGILYDTQSEPLSWRLRVRIIKDISKGIEYLHDGAVPPVIHRDIKPANILLDSSMNARVADFGLSKEMNAEIPVSGAGVKGTYGYVDPEYISTYVFTEKSDIYSLGILIFELITGRSPQQGLMDYVELAAMGADGKEGWAELLDSRLNGECDWNELGTLAAVAYQCVQKVSEKRPRMRDIVQSLSKLDDKRAKRVTFALRSSATGAELSMKGLRQGIIQENSVQA